MPFKSFPQRVSGAHQVYAGDFVESSRITPNFHTRLQRREELPINPYKAESTYGRCTPGSTWNGSQFWDLDAPLPTFDGAARGLTIHGVSGTEPNIKPAMLREVSNKLALGLRERDLDVGVAVGELRATANTLTEVCGRIASSFRDLIRGHPVSAVNQLIYGAPQRTGWMNDKIGLTLANNWLAWSYGIKPLLSDVAGAIDAVSFASNRLLTLKFKELAFRQVNRKWDSTQKPPYPGSFFIKGSCTGTMKLKGEMVVNVSSPTYDEASNLGLTNPFNWVWELIPYSFVVDWFIPVGDWVNSLTPIQHLTLKRGHYVWKAINGKSQNHRGYVGYKPSTGSYRCEYYERQVMPSFPSYSFEVPSIGLSISQCLSAISLLTQQFVSRR